MRIMRRYLIIRVIRVIRVISVISIIRVIKVIRVILERGVRRFEKKVPPEGPQPFNSLSVR